MAQLTDSQIRQIIQKASLLEKLKQAEVSFTPPQSTQELEQIFEISDDLNIPRDLVYEAYLEHAGVPIHEPFLEDTLDRNSAKATGFAQGSLDKELLNELKHHTEYHFNTVGNLSHRRNKITWKASPTGISRFIASATSPEVEFEQVDGSTKISISQSLKTQNKWYIPPLLTAAGGFLLLTAVIFDRVGNDFAPALIFSGLLLLSSFFFARFVKNKSNKKKKNLLDLTETLLGKVERHSKAKATTKESGTIDSSDMLEEQQANENIEIKPRSKVKE